jgi:hypothetical protein
LAVRTGRREGDIGRNHTRRPNPRSFWPFTQCSAHPNEGHRRFKALIETNGTRSEACGQREKSAAVDYIFAILTGASPEKPSALDPAGVKSIIRPRTNGPRSLILTTTLLPLYQTARSDVPRLNARESQLRRSRFCRRGSVDSHSFLYPGGRPTWLNQGNKGLTGSLNSYSTCHQAFLVTSNEARICVSFRMAT